MAKDAYPALFHNIHQAIATVSFPCTKQAMLQMTKDCLVGMDWNQEIPLCELIQPIKKDSFSCAADFYCCLIAAMT